jgi:hypothetical protein
MDIGAIWFAKNGAWQGGASQAEIEAGNTANAAVTGLSDRLYPMCGAYLPTTLTANFGATAFAHTVPAGFFSVSAGTGAEIVVNRVGGAAGATLSAQIDLVSTEGPSNISVSAVVPTSMESSYQSRGAQHIWAWDILTPLGDTGSGTAASWTLAGTASRVSSTVPGCLGAMEIAAMGGAPWLEGKATLTCPDDMGWDADRTWVLVLEHHMAGTWVHHEALLSDDSWAGAGAGILLAIADWTGGGTVHLSRTDGLYLLIPDFGANQDTATYLALRFTASSRTFDLTSQLDGQTKQTGVDTIVSLGATSLNVPLYIGKPGGWGNAAISDCHFFAVIDRLLTDAEISADIAMLGF